MRGTEIASSLSPGDGRVQRRHRTSRAIVEAMLALIEEGDVRPTAAAIAARAGVSVRSIGQRFGTQDQLLRDAAAALGKRLPAFSPTDAPDVDRAAQLVAHRAAIAETTANLRRAAVLAGSSEVVTATARMWRISRRAEVDAAFAEELARLAPRARRDARRALEGAVSSALWDELRVGMGLSASAAERIMLLSVRSILGASAISKEPT